MSGSPEREDKQRRALCTLAQISNQQERTQQQWEQKKQNRRRPLASKRHRVSVDFQSTKAEKLPMILNKHNLSENHQKFLQASGKVNSYILFEKGLGVSGTVNIKRSKGSGRYLQENSKYIRMYSENSEQEIKIIKEWLSLKKESCKSFNSLISKRKPKPRDDHSFCLSIKNIL